MSNKVHIILDNVYAKIIGATKDIEHAIWNELSFLVEEFGQEHPRRRHLFNRKTKKTYTGLVPYVERILKEMHVDYDIVDSRDIPEKNADFKLAEFVDDAKTIPLTFRPYQKEIVDRCEPRECLQAATGAGKTFMMAAIIEKFNVKPVLVFADKMSLVTQIKEEFEKFLGIEIGIIGGGVKEVRDITICSVQSMLKEDEMLKEAKMIMFDECLSYDSKVLMPNGSYEEIGKLVEQKYEGLVMSYNHKAGKMEPKKVVSHSKTLLSQNNKKFMKLTVKKANGEKEVIECTDNHRIWSEDSKKYIHARDLVKGQQVVTTKGSSENG
ncbi:DNA helicase [Bacillus phage G]|uniref:Gp221 n=1 Tax=Bacillus phage G TaxID=2884420 RepID=G3M9W2_9CAUD|nr:DNA helicase [Bacillus phage G]AEO93480.1 gp221 [Bacillus phage G]